MVYSEGTVMLTRFLVVLATVLPAEPVVVAKDPPKPFVLPDVSAKMTWSPNGKFLAAADFSQTRIWNPVTGELLAVFEGRTHPGVPAMWRPDGKVIASAGYGDKTIRLWDPGTGKQTAVLKGHTDVVQSVAWSPDGKTIASAGDDLTVRV